MTTAPATPPAPTATRAAVINAYGEPDQLVQADVPLSAPAQAQVLVDVAAVAVNPVTGLQAGDRVAAMVFQPAGQRGTYAKYVTLDAALLAKVGAVGRHVVALAAQAGLDVTGAAALERAGDLRALGAALAVGRSDFTGVVRDRYPSGVDAAIDLVGGTTAHEAFGLVRDGGRYVTAVPPYVDPSGRFESERDITLHVLTVRPDTGRLRELLALASQGIMSTAVEFTYPLDAAAAAHRRQAAGGLKGRVVLLP